MPGAADTPLVRYADPFPRAERLVLSERPSGALEHSVELQKLAAEQRARMAFESAAILYRAAGRLATSQPSDEEADELLSAIGRHRGTGESMEEIDAESLLRLAESIGPHVSDRTADWPEGMPDPPLRRTRCFSATAAAIIGEASCMRLLGRTVEAAELLESLRFVGPPEAEEAEEQAAAAAEGGTEKEESDAPPPTEIDDDAGCGGLGEGPRALSAFWHELCSGQGGDGDEI